MTRWAAFVGLTGAVLTGVLVLARLSQRAVERPDRGDENPRGYPAGDTVEAPGSGDTVEAPESSDTVEAPEPDGGGRSGRMVTDGTPPSGDEPGSADLNSTDQDSANTNLTDRNPTDRNPTPAEADVDGADRIDDPRAVTNGRGRRTVDRSRAGDAEVTPFGIERDRSGERERLDSPELTPGALLANVALTQGLFGFVLVAGAWYFQVPRRALGIGAGVLESAPATVGVGLLFGLALWIGNELAASVADATGVDYDEGIREMLAPDSAAGWALLLGVTLPIIAGVEEFAFRAAAIGAPAAGFDVSPWALAVVSSVAFALGHGAQGRAGVLVTGTLGLALAAGFVLTESLAVVIVAHYLVNALEFGVHEGLGVPDPAFGKLR